MNNLITILNIVLSAATILGGVGAYKFGFHRAVSEVQERVISALETELNEIRTQLADVKKENIRLNHTLDTIIAALAKNGTYITISGDMITIENSHDGSVHVTRITESQ